MHADASCLAQFHAVQSLQCAAECAVKTMAKSVTIVWDVDVHQVCKVLASMQLQQIPDKMQ